MNYVYRIDMDEDFDHVVAESMGDAEAFMLTEVGTELCDIVSIANLGSCWIATGDE